MLIKMRVGGTADLATIVAACGKTLRGLQESPPLKVKPQFRIPESVEVSSKILFMQIIKKLYSYKYPVRNSNIHFFKWEKKKTQ